jgi:hypothetical protein
MPERRQSERVAAAKATKPAQVDIKFGRPRPKPLTQKDRESVTQAVAAIEDNIDSDKANSWDEARKRGNGSREAGRSAKLARTGMYF